MIAPVFRSGALNKEFADKESYIGEMIRQSKIREQSQKSMANPVAAAVPT